MSDVRISQLSKAASLSGNEFIPVTQVDSAHNNTPTTFVANISALADYVRDVTVPTGVIWSFAGSLEPTKNSVPTGWLLCNGSIQPVKNYRKLYQTIGNVYGATAAPGILFKLPDLRGRIILGYNSYNELEYPSFGNFSGNPISFGKYDGEFNHKLTVPEMPSHTHECIVLPSKIPFLNMNPTYPHYGSVEQGQVGGADGPGSVRYNPFFPVTIESAGGDAYHNTTPPYIAINYIIKY